MKTYHIHHSHKSGHIPASEIDSIMKTRFDWSAFRIAVIVTAPGLLFHELGHKFAALALGLTATFHAAYFWLAIGVVLRLMNFKWIFFVPAFVALGGDFTVVQGTITAFAGPGMNLLLFLVAWAALKWGKFSQRTFSLLYFTKQINLFLFVFNLLPIPPFDGFKFFSGLVKIISALF